MVYNIAKKTSGVSHDEKNMFYLCGGFRFDVVFGGMRIGSGGDGRRKGYETGKGFVHSENEKSV